MLLRKIVGVVSGIVLANLLIVGLEQILPLLPFGRTVPLDGLPDPDQQPGYVAVMPMPAKLWIVTGWLLGAFVGALVAFRIARWDFAGWIVAGLVAAAGIANSLLIVQPLWMTLCAIALPFIGAVFAFGVSRRWRAADLHLRH